MPSSISSGRFVRWAHLPSFRRNEKNTRVNRANKKNAFMSERWPFGIWSVPVSNSSKLMGTHNYSAYKGTRKDIMGTTNGKTVFLGFLAFNQFGWGQKILKSNWSFCYQDDIRIPGIQFRDLSRWHTYHSELACRLGGAKQLSKKRLGARVLSRSLYMIFGIIYRSTSVGRWAWCFYFFVNHNQRIYPAWKKTIVKLQSTYAYIIRI